MKYKIIPGHRFGKLVIQNLASKPDHSNLAPNKCRWWKCLCDCGNITVVPTQSLTKGNTKSCGCYRLEFRQTHGHWRHPLYLTWYNMLSRCEKLTAPNYDNYGGKGISVCSAWHSLSGFLDWAKSHPRPAGFTLDRINVYGNYEPGNCRWANGRLQSNNRRNNRKFTIQGYIMTFAQAIRLYAVVSEGSVRQRLAKGWNIWDALTIPRGHKPC